MDTKQSPSESEIARRALEVTNQLYDPSLGIKEYVPELGQKIAGLNRLHQGKLDNIGQVRWLVSGQSPRGGDWAINRGGITHLLDGLEQKKVVAGVVVLVMKKQEIINYRLVAEVWKKIKDARWLNMGNGDFCWVDRDFNLADRNRDRFIVDPDLPM